MPTVQNAKFVDSRDLKPVERRDRAGPRLHELLGKTRRYQAVHVCRHMHGPAIRKRGKVSLSGNEDWPLDLAIYSPAHRRVLWTAYLRGRRFDSRCHVVQQSV